MGSPALPVECIEVVLRAVYEVDEDEPELKRALERRRWFRSAALVTRQWSATARSLLSETIIISRLADIDALDPVVARGEVDLARARTLFVDDTRVLNEDVVRELEEGPGDEEERYQLFRTTEAALFSRFVERAAAHATCMARLRHFIASTSRLLRVVKREDMPRVTILAVDDDYDEGPGRMAHLEDVWPTECSAPQECSVMKLGAQGESIGSAPQAFAASLRRLRLGVEQPIPSAVGFESCLFTSPAPNLQDRRIFVGRLLETDPKSLFRTVDASQPSMPSLRTLSIACQFYDIFGIGEGTSTASALRLFEYLPPSLVRLELTDSGAAATAHGRAYHVHEWAPLAVRALADALQHRDLAIGLRALVFDIRGDAPQTLVADEEPHKGLRAVCEARGIDLKLRC